MLQGRPTVFCIGTNHRSLELADRERFHMAPELLRSLLPGLVLRHKLPELCVLSTCNRFEIFGLTPQAINHEQLLMLMIDLQQHNPLASGLGEDLIRRSVYTFEDDQAISHIFNVASGLDSLILGETQITGQFKDAISFARDCGTLGPILDRLTQDALATVKKVRTHTAIGRRPVSISHAAIDLANRVFGAISEHKVLIIGAGEMAQVAAKYTAKYKPQQLILCNRTVSRAAAIAEELQLGVAYSIDELPELLVEADIIIAATAADHFIITAEMVSKALARKRGRSLFIVDIALPRDVEPSVANLENVFLFDIDDLKQVVDEHFEERKQAAIKAEVFVAESVRSFQRWLNTSSLKPALSQFRLYLEDLSQRELEKTLSRDIWRQLSAEQHQQLVLLLQSITNKIVADAGSTIKAPPESLRSEELASALRHLFVVGARKDSAS